MTLRSSANQLSLRVCVGLFGRRVTVERRKITLALEGWGWKVVPAWAYSNGSGDHRLEDCLVLAPRGCHLDVHWHSEYRGINAPDIIMYEGDDELGYVYVNGDSVGISRTPKNPFIPPFESTPHNERDGIPERDMTAAKLVVAMTCIAAILVGLFSFHIIPGDTMLALIDIGSVWVALRLCLLMRRGCSHRTDTR